MSNQIYQHWRVDVDNEQIAWWWLDKKNASTNTLDSDVLNELELLINETTTNPTLRGVVIASAKPSGFIAGANVQQFTKINTQEEAFQLLRHGQNVFHKLADLKKPTVAMIDGFCLGGGLELALACRYRVAEDGLKTKLGLPEVKLGIHPGWGGTARLPQLIGPVKAMDLILSGRTFSAMTAAKLGVVDSAVPKRHLCRAARYYVTEAPTVRQPSFIDNFWNFPFVRSLLVKILRKKVEKQARLEHYPAPYAVIENWSEHRGVGLQAMESEVQSIGKLILGETAQNLLSVFFLQEKLKGLAKGMSFTAQHVHVIGAGVMGGDIAAWCALRGLNVTLQDRAPALIAPAIKRAYGLFKGILKQPRLIQAAMDRLLPDVEGMGVVHADVIIEAISENLSAKQSLFKHLEKQAKPEAILATNTSSLPLSAIREGMQAPERLVGIHFFNPVAKLPLVEIVRDEVTKVAIVDHALSFVRQIDKLPLPVASTPGFLVNRVLMPYMMEAILLRQEGVAQETIDQAALDFGMPMGPIELADTVGLDICLSVAKYLNTEAHGTSTKQFEMLEKLVSEGHLGRKTGRGFYTYHKGKPQKKKTVPSTAIPVTDRLMLRLLNEAMACYREQVVSEIALLDAGMIFGTGFAPFRGGPMHYAKKQGYEVIAKKLQNLQESYGDRFNPDAGWTA